MLTERSQFGVKWLWVKGVEALVGVPVIRFRRVERGRERLDELRI